ncbi:MAG: carboxypeptidase-like regulatory domain-containing protein [Anaerolineales bacterium]|nr:carboxypeptidase-like regulatory domain-containing protein [Anaerolineales bacterium]MDP2776636.1 carboxypeptidase-like regulatory domain-containing protein [Anaerolineales bacterium]
MSKKFLLLFVLILSACGQRRNPSEPLMSGIEVQVFVGPMCPVMQVRVECPDLPYQATLTVLNTSRKEVLKFETEEDGRYIVSLPPGDYILRPENPQEMQLP